MSRLIQPRGLKSDLLVWISDKEKSRLIQPRGLKSASANPDADADSRGLYSLVD